MKKNQKLDEVFLLILEAGMLKRVKRSGWSVLGISNAESVADHSFRCAVLGYVIAVMEKADRYKVLLMTLFNDIQEARTCDLHKLAQRYFDAEQVEDKAFYEQVAGLPLVIKDELSDMHKEYRRQKNKESLIARDADILECLIQAREYHEQGFKQAERFTQKAPRHLKTKSAKKLWAIAKKTTLTDWWFSISEFKR